MLMLMPILLYSKGEGSLVPFLGFPCADAHPLTSCHAAVQLVSQLFPGILREHMLPRLGLSYGLTWILNWRNAASRTSALGSDCIYGIEQLQDKWTQQFGP